MDQQIYLDHAATTPVDPAVLDAMLPYLIDRFGNASSVYSLGAQSHDAVETARNQVAELLNAKDPGEIIFTSGGTESDNWALRGAANAARDRGRHIITTPIEHHAVIEPACWLRKDGFEVSYLTVDSSGMVDPTELHALMRPDTTVVSVMHANNEIGTILPIRELAMIARTGGALFHTDAVQTVGKIPVDVQDLGIDLLSMSGHKIYAPKGIGALFIRRGTRIWPHMIGGSQERSRRGGTYNVPGIVALGQACSLAVDYLPTEEPRQVALRDRLIRFVLESIPRSRLTGSRNSRLPHNASFAFKDVEGESLVLNLDAMGVYCSAGSACSSGATEPSHVLRALALEEDWIRGAVRLTLGRSTSEADIDRAGSFLLRAVEQVRSLQTA